MPELTNSGPQLLSRPAASALEQSIADSVEAVGRQSDVDEALSVVPGDKEAQRPCSHKVWQVHTLCGDARWLMADMDQ